MHPQKGYLYHVPLLPRPNHLAPCFLYPHLPLLSLHSSSNLVQGPQPLPFRFPRPHLSLVEPGTKWSGQRRLILKLTMDQWASSN
ncbi:hypothetical protein JHK82_050777 [Glycine max]|uniref:Uncharacterized protein n=2 Tax=Glycine subgen. Soja TaxID=1462606 RepID=K7MSZ7_SOYBN|nr:hypothetical protein JHK86_050633 [Glycine max]KAG4924917.1 hypothetical protein JHK87_050457 [Glycine soja]KAG4936558.1 hypothetical protein JHK85_051477 [Glycine max]KAG5091999.1 hypothetical protein JHK82_050777 [Glycine max]KAG5095081.1 hypothetical protein JHK84_050669 [Glycine max]